MKMMFCFFAFLFFNNKKLFSSVVFFPPSFSSKIKGAISK